MGRLATNGARGLLLCTKCSGKFTKSGLASAGEEWDLGWWVGRVGLWEKANWWLADWLSGEIGPGGALEEEEEEEEEEGYRGEGWTSWANQKKSAWPFSFVLPLGNRPGPQCSPLIASSPSKHWASAD